MKRSVFAVVFITLLSLAFSVSASGVYMVNPFYAIESSGEYKAVREQINGDLNNMYFQWSRIARNPEGKMVFTNLYAKSISPDDKHTEFGFPGSLNLDDYKTRYPEGKAYLSVFFQSANFSDGRNSAVELLNMSQDEWKEFIIAPMLKMVDEDGFDGIVLDFEGLADNYSISGYSDEQRSGIKKKYNAFLKYLKSFIKGKKLAVCVHPSNVAGYFDGYDFKFINDTADYIIIMAYDYEHYMIYTQADNVPEELIGRIKSVSIHETQPYGLVEGAVKKAVEEFGAAPGKIILGLDLTGRKWTKLQRKFGDRIYSYYKEDRPYLDDIESLNTEEQYLEGSKTCKKVLTGENILAKDKEAYEKEGVVVDQVEYYYESPKSLHEKYYSLVSGYKLAGISVWRLGTGSASAWKNLISDFNTPKVSFSDVREADWFYQALKLLVLKGIVNGNPDGSFAPENEINADAFIKMAVTSLGYTDIKNASGYWASNYIDKAIELKLVRAGEFSAYNLPISRGKMAVIISRALKEEYDSNLEQYGSLIKDYGSISPELRDYVLMAYSKGIITGLPGGDFGPELKATRAQAVTMIARMLDPQLRKLPVLN